MIIPTLQGTWNLREKARRASSLAVSADPNEPLTYITKDEAELLDMVLTQFMMESSEAIEEREADGMDRLIEGIKGTGVFESVERYDPEELMGGFITGKSDEVIQPIIPNGCESMIQSTVKENLTVQPTT